MIHLTHFLHGSKFALSDTEVAADEKNGWVRYNPDTPTEPSEAAQRVKRKYTRQVTDKTIEQPNGSTPASDESEGE